MEIVLEAEHTHFYPGHEGRVVGDAPAESMGGGGLSSRIVFADGVVTGGTLKNVGGSWELEIPPYTTAAGTDVAAKRWQVTFRREADGRARFRIASKLANPNN
jgi:hypothetical protein